MIIAVLPEAINVILFTLLVCLAVAGLFFGIASVVDPPKLPILGKVAFSVLIFTIAGASIYAMIPLYGVIDKQKHAGDNPDLTTLTERVNKVTKQIKWTANQEIHFYAKHHKYTRFIGNETVWISTSDNGQVIEIENRVIFDKTNTQYFIILDSKQTKLKDCINHSGFYKVRYRCNLNTGYWK